MNYLKQTNANIIFISFEPLLSAIPEIELKNIDWIIVGGESGPRARALNKDWVINIKNQCISQKTPFFFKQWGGYNKKKNGRLLEGREWNEMPFYDDSYKKDNQYELKII